MLARLGQVLWWATLAAALLWYASSAEALCIYTGKHFEKSTQPDFDGRLYAKTTLRDEFIDSTLVIRGTAVSSRNVPSGAEFPEGTIYTIRVDQTFKGSAPKTLRYFTERNSGMFDPDVGTPFLLFLDPMAANHGDQKLAPGAFLINYNCGVSRPWAKVTPGDQDQLNALSKSGH